jgi:hypothetical protein
VYANTITCRELLLVPQVLSLARLYVSHLQDDTEGIADLVAALQDAEAMLAQGNDDDGAIADLTAALQTVSVASRHGRTATQESRPSTSNRAVQELLLCTDAWDTSR